MTAKKKPVIFWFRNDLRLRDNIGLSAAVEEGAPVIPLYIHDDAGGGDWKAGAASKFWLHQSLAALQENLAAAGFHPLVLLKGDAPKALEKFAAESDAAAVFCSRRYEPWAVEQDGQIAAALEKKDVEFSAFDGFLLLDPTRVLNKSGQSYKVFTPYSHACLAMGGIHPPIAAPKPKPCGILAEGVTLDDLGLMPDIPWYKGIDKSWTPGEKGAATQLKKFIDNGLADYKTGRDYPAEEGGSRLSPHLHFGEVSVRDVWHRVGAVAAKSPHSALAAQAQGYLRQLLWREFSWYLLHHFPALPERPWNGKFEKFKWHKNDKMLKAWQRGLTGYPIIDAGMRQLWQTGWMHNRVRMLVGSFLVKNLLQNWRHGEDWFWDTLVDADLGNNAQGWQWIAGCGADAAPYFRIFNPVLQGQKFDAEGEYIKTYVPELKNLPARYIHTPWEAPPPVLSGAGVTLGKNYPHPVVALDEARARALEAYNGTK